MCTVGRARGTASSTQSSGVDPPVNVIGGQNQMYHFSLALGVVGLSNFHALDVDVQEKKALVLVSLSVAIGAQHLCSGSEAGSYLRLIDVCITQL